MAKINLSKRLQTIKNMVDANSIVADIGADHGYLISRLCLDNVIKKGYAVENKKGPYKHLEETIAKCNLKDRITPYFDSGIRPLKNDVETLVLAGMGTDNILSILKERPSIVKDVKQIVCDSHTNLYELRKQVQRMGFGIDKEEIIEEGGIFYEIVSFKRNATVYDDEKSLTYGPLLLQKKSETFRKKYSLLLTKNMNLIINKNLTDERRKELTLYVEELKSII